MCVCVCVCVCVTPTCITWFIAISIMSTCHCLSAYGLRGWHLQPGGETAGAEPEREKIYLSICLHLLNETCVSRCHHKDVTLTYILSVHLHWKTYFEHHVNGSTGLQVMFSRALPGTNCAEPAGRLLISLPLLLHLLIILLLLLLILLLLFVRSLTPTPVSGNLHLPEYNHH